MEDALVRSSPFVLRSPQARGRRDPLSWRRAHTGLRHDKLGPPYPTGVDRMFVPLSATG
jgi:hypothetical protein